MITLGMQEGLKNCFFIMFSTEIELQVGYCFRRRLLKKGPLSVQNENGNVKQQLEHIGTIYLQGLIQERIDMSTYSALNCGKPYKLKYYA